MSNRKDKKDKKKSKKKQDINWEEFKQPEKKEEPEPEEEEPPTAIDCCDRCLFSSLGYILLYCGILVIFFSERDHKYSQRDISYISSNLQLIDITSQKPADINTILATAIEHKYPIHFTDNISNINDKNMIVMDDRTDLSYPGIALKINTEMYQWVEAEETIRKEGTTQTEIKYSYSKQWANTYHDSTEFNKKDELYNPQPTVSKLSIRTLWVDQIIIGQNKNLQLYLAKSLYTKLSKRNLWKNVTKSSAEYSEMEMWEMRDGYLFRPYDKAESWYAEVEKQPEEEEEEEEEEEQDKEDEDINDNDNDNGGVDENSDDNDVFSKKKETLKERVRLDKPRIMIGDIRMTVFSLDTRGQMISYLGGVKFLEDWNQYVLIPWKSPTNHKFAMVEYGNVTHNEAIDEFSTENVLKLWLTRIFTVIFMFIGLMILQNVLQNTVIMLRLPIKPVPFETWLQTIIGALCVSCIIWIIVVVIAYIIGIIHLALTFVVLIIIGLFINNKTVDNTKELTTKQKQKKNT